MYRGPLRRTLFISMSIIVPIFANGLRALGIIVLAHLEGSASAVAADHVLYGWLFFTAGDHDPDRDRNGARAEVRQNIAGPAGGDRLARLRSRLPGGSPVAVAAAILLAVAGPAYAARLDNLFPLPCFLRRMARLSHRPGIPCPASLRTGIRWCAVPIVNS